jgi:cyclopropane fatty-acyl-phospholipid synthase-like methyltransferase
MRRAVAADARTRVVQVAYDALGSRFGDWTARLEGEPLDRFLGELTARLERGARVLELGCGDGRTTTLLAPRFEVVGVDLSEEQLRLARAAVPGGTFVHADLLELELPAEAHDAVTAFYSFMHVPRDHHAELLARIWTWLRPGGLFLAPLSTLGGPDRVERWLGVEMFFSGWDAETNGRLVRAAGFEVLVDEVIPMREADAGDETAFLWVLARKPA